MEKTKDSDRKSDSASAKEKAAPDISGELERIISAYAKSVEEAQTRLDSATKEAWEQYWQSSKELLAQATRSCIDSYAAYLEAYRRLPAQPDHAALEMVRTAWAAHVKACDYTSNIAKAWSATQQKLYHALQEANSSAAKAFGAATERYFEGVRSVLSLHGLTNLDPAAVQFVTYQIATTNAVAA